MFGTKRHRHLRSARTRPARSAWIARVRPVWILAAVLFVAPVSVVVVLNGFSSQAEPSSEETGPRTLSEVWPAARPVTLAQARAGGASYEPRLVLDAARSVGLLTGADGAVSLVLLTGADPDHPRTLHTTTMAEMVVFDAITATSGQVYWMASAPDEQGVAQSTLWAADLSGGPSRLVTTETGHPQSQGSQYDLQVADGRVRWVAVRSVDPAAAELRSVATTGGAVEVKPLDRSYTMTAWPWLAADSDGSGGAVQLVNAVTGEHITVATAKGDRVRCGPAWCRSATPGPSGDSITMLRPKGGERYRIEGDGEIGTVDVAIADRFELLTVVVPTGAQPEREALTLFDLRGGRSVFVDVVTSRAARDGWMWWETISDSGVGTWHLLDLTSLPDESA